MNDRTLTEMLKEIKDADELLGTGYDAMMLSNLLFVTRPASEIKDMDRAAEWAASGMPEYDAGEMPRKLVIAFRTDEDRVKFVEQTKLVVDTKREAWNWSTWWPERERDDLASVKFVKEPTA